MEYQVLEEGSKGILGFGAKPVVIQATRKQEELTEQVKGFIRPSRRMGLMAEIRVREEEENIGESGRTEEGIDHRLPRRNTGCAPIPYQPCCKQRKKP